MPFIIDPRHHGEHTMRVPCPACGLGKRWSVCVVPRDGAPPYFESHLADDCPAPCTLTPEMEAVVETESLRRLHVKLVLTGETRRQAILARSRAS